MRGVYSAASIVSALAGASTPGKTVLYITAPSTAAIQIYSVWCLNATNETNEQLRFQLRRIGTLGTPTMTTTVTPAKQENGDQASGAVVKFDCTGSEPTYTASTTMDDQGVSSIGGYLFQGTPEEQIIIPPSGSVGLLDFGTHTALDAIAGLRWREIG